MSIRILPSYKDFLIYVIKHKGACPPIYKEVDVSCRSCYFNYDCNHSHTSIKRSMAYRKMLAIEKLKAYSYNTLEEVLFEELL